MRFVILAAVVGILCPAPARAARAAVRGMVDRVDAGPGMLMLRQVNGLQPITVAPDAALTLNGRPGLLEEIQVNARAEIAGWRDGTGRLHADVVRILQPAAPTRLAALPPGAVLTGEVVGLYPQAGALVLRTPTGFRTVSLGPAAILLEGRPVTLYDLGPGDRIQVQRTLPAGGISPVPTLAVVLSTQAVAGSRQTFRARLPGQQGGQRPDPATPAAPAAPVR